MKNSESINLTTFDKILILIPSLIIPLIYTVKVPDPALMPRFIALSLFVGILSLFLFKRSFNSQKEINNIIIPIPYLAIYILYIAITGLSLFYTINFADGIFDWFKSIIVFSFILLFTQYFYQKTNYLSILIFSILVFSVVINCIGYYQFFIILQKTEFDKKSTYEISSAFAHRNLFSEILFLTLPFSAFGIYHLKKQWKLFALIATLFTLCSIAFYLTRAVWVATIGSFAFISIIALIAFRKELIKPEYRKLALVSLSSLFFIIVLTSVIVFKTYGLGILKENFSSIFETRYGSVHHRLLLWQKTFDIIKQNLWTGTGLGSWNIEILKYGVEGLQSEDGITFYQRPHNDFLWVLSDSGFVAFILYLSLILVPFYLLLRMVFTKTDNSKKVLYLSLLFGLTGYIIISNFGFPKERIEHLIYFSLLVVPAFLEWRSYNKINKRVPIRPALYVVIPMLLLTIFTGFKRFSAERHVMEAYKARSRSGWDKLVKEIDNAKSTLCTMDPTSTPLDWYRGSANYNRGNTKEALVDFKAAYEINPYHIHVLNNIATCAQLTGDTKTAIEFYEKALSIYPEFEDALLNLAAIHFNNGDIEKAYASIRRADPDIKSEKFNQYAITILNKRLERYIFPEDKLVAEVIVKILKNEEWTINILKKSIATNIEFEQQLIKDAVYVLEEVDHTISTEEAKTLKTKYEIF